MGAFSYEDGYRNKMLGCLLFPKYNSGLQLKIKKTKYRVSGMEGHGMAGRLVTHLLQGLTV